MHNTLEGNICKTTVFVQNVYFPFIWFCRGRRCSKCDCIFAEWSKCHDKLCHFACWWWISSVLSLMLQLVLHVQSVLFICHDVQRLNDEWFPPPWKLMLALCSYNGWCAELFEPLLHRQPYFNVHAVMMCLQLSSPSWLGQPTCKTNPATHGMQRAKRSFC